MQQYHEKVDDSSRQVGRQATRVHWTAHSVGRVLAKPKAGVSRNTLLPLRETLPGSVDRGEQKVILDIPQGIKNVCDAVFGAAAVATLFNWLTGVLSFIVLLTAAIYGVFRVYEMQTTQKVLKWLSRLWRSH